MVERLKKFEIAEGVFGYAGRPHPVNFIYFELELSHSEDEIL